MPKNFKITFNSSTKQEHHQLASGGKETKD